MKVLITNSNNFTWNILTFYPVSGVRPVVIYPVSGIRPSLKSLQVRLPILRRMHASNLNNTAATWEHTSPHLDLQARHTLHKVYPTIQLKWPEITDPVLFTIPTHAW